MAGVGMSKRILIIDDSRLTRRHVARIVRAQGHETMEAGNGRIGLERVETEAPDCILLDILMPEMDGIAFLKEAGARGIDVAVIVMSADAQTPDRTRQLEDLGAVAVVDKPPRGETSLLQAVEAALRDA